MKQELRPIEIPGHQRFTMGWFHGFGTDEKGLTFAIIENLSGYIEKEYFIVGIRFLDRDPNAKLQQETKGE